ncbi:EamA family transporter [Pengzhenrongella sicca]|uniref:EamA family transporter n=1 Tax=Pengzhenrongella sicca TaxID=2819238 RepID=A0A8A4ZER8_9MICO|nr:EamA family transporter [Pengzhenrongella sicca]QTE30394.1 EamA family transporter [Pengzhenrongella sicca]
MNATGRGWTILVTGLGPAAWGTTYLVTTQWLPPDRPLLASVLRALPAGLLLVAWGRRLPHGTWWLRAAVLGTLNIGVFFALLFFSAYRLPGGVAATLGAVQPLIVAGLSALILGERLTVRAVCAGIVGVVGVALLVLRASVGLDALGLAAGLAAAAAMALGVVLTKRWGRPVPLLAFTGWQLTFGGLVLVPILLAVEGLPGAVTAAQVAGFAYLGLVNTAFGYAVWFRGIERLPAASVSFLGLLSPVVAATAGWLVLAQSLSGWQLVGMGLALGALVAGQRGTARRDPRSDARDSLVRGTTTPGLGLRPPAVIATVSSANTGLP